MKLQNAFRSKLLRWMTAGWLGAMLLGGSVWAQESGAEGDQDPGRGVARLSLMNGNISVRRGDSGDWVGAAINAPLMADDTIYSAGPSRAELQFDYYNRLRLGEETQVRLSELEDRRYQVQISSGTATFSALPGSNAQVELSTPAASVRPLAEGSYRITVQQDGTVWITVRKGEADIYTPQGSQRLGRGRTMMARMGQDGTPEFQFVSAIQKDDWDQFNDQRDKELKRGQDYYSRNYVSRDVYGAEDLYGYGDWNYVAPYGYVWSPTVASGWAPYRYGRWVWQDWYGWTWVSYDPWGWAPYHYGRWFYYGNRWCWFPGAVVGSRHYWRPALVAWVGWGGGGVSVGFGSYGWIPLAPYERIHPWWGSRYYGGYRNVNIVQNNINIVNNVNVTNVYRNARITNSISVVNGSNPGSGAGQAFHGNAAMLQRANLVQGAVPAAPTRDNLRYSDSTPRMPTVGRSAPGQPGGNQNFIARNAAPQVQRVPFQEQAQVMQQASRQAFTRGGQAPPSMGGNSGAAANAATAGPANGRGFGGNAAAQGASNGRGGWPSAASSGVVSNESANSGRGGNTSWQRFGDPNGNASGGRGGVSGGASAGRGVAGAPPSMNATESQSQSQAGAAFGRGSDRSVAAPAQSQSRGGWSTFGDPSQRGNGNWRSPSGTVSSNEGRSRGEWSTGGGSGSGVSPSTSRSESRGMQAPQADRGGNWSTGGGAGVSPRSYDSGSRGESGGSGGRSAPSRMDNGAGRSYDQSPRTSAPSRSYEAAPSRSYEAPRMSAPSRSYEAPRMSAPSRSESPRMSAPSSPRMSAPPSMGNGGGGGGAPHGGGGGNGGGGGRGRGR